MTTEEKRNMDLNKVYEIASEIASEFESLVDICGSENLRPVVLKVVEALECLEAIVSKVQETEKQLDDLKADFGQLNSKRALYQEERQKLVQELEQMEESWEHEVHQLRSLIKKLQLDKQNMKCLLEVNDTYEQVVEEKVSDENLIRELQSLVTILRSRLQKKDVTLKKFMIDHDALQNQIGCLNEVIKELRSHLEESRTELKQMWKNRTDLEFKVGVYEQSLSSLRNCLHESPQHTMDVEEELSLMLELSHEMNEDIPTAGEAVNKIKYLMQVQDSLQERVSVLEGELSRFKQQSCSSNSVESEDLIHQLSSNSSQEYGIRHIFQLFLGVLSFPRCYFRPSYV